MKKYMKIARFDHWIKNFFVFPGSLLALILTKTHMEINVAVALVLCFFATCCIASANYVINEWLDAAFDQFHPTKKNRVSVTEVLNGKLVYLEYACFAAGGLLLSSLISLPFLFTEVLLLVMGVLYNVKPMRTKDVPYLDVLSESINNAIRLVLGWFAVTSALFPPSSIVLGFWMGGAFLMAVKRFSEYRMIGDPAIAGLYRKSFRHYSEKSLLISSFFYAMCSIFFIGVFLIKYRIELLLAIPFLCGLFCIYLNLSYKIDSAAQKPEKLYKEKFLMLYVFVFCGIIALLMSVRIPELDQFLNTSLISLR